jgi:predicted ATPase
MIDIIVSKPAGHIFQRSFSQAKHLLPFDFPPAAAHNTDSREQFASASRLQDLWRTDMIRRIEALNYRCLRYIDQSLTDFHVLVGPNASGKTTFLDVISFLSDLAASGLEKAIDHRTSDFFDLLFAHQGKRFELAVELEIPDSRRRLLPSDKEFDTVRYEVAIGWAEKASEVHILDEKVILSAATPKPAKQKTLFPQPPIPPHTIMTGRSHQGQRRVITKKYEGNDNYYSEVHAKGGKGWAPSFRLGPKQSALGNLPADEERFPVSSWLQDVLRDGVQEIMLNSLALRKSSAPGQGLGFRSDGANLPWVLHNLEKEDSKRYSAWISHVRTALEDIAQIETIEIPDTRSRYLKLIYQNGLEVPSWMTSDGTLRLLALTVPAYLPSFKGIYLIEEPENGIHPMAMETVFQALRSVYSAQILLATHSPVVLSIADPETVICFKKDADGATDMVLGSEHPELRNWQGEVNLGVLHASGVLG